MLVKTSTEAGIALLTLERPDRRNALSPELVADLRATLADADADDAVRVIVVTGAGRAFCAGGDLGAMAADGPHAAWAGRGAYADLLGRIHRMSKPLIAAVNGDALGGGFGLAMACDMIVADPGAKLGTPEVKLGLFPMIILAELVRNLPRKVLSEMIFAGRRLSPAELERWGLINRVSAPDAAVAEALALAAEVAAFSPVTLRLGREALRHVADREIESELRLLHGLLEANLMTEDAMEGVSAFLQKRPPNWKGR